MPRCAKTRTPLGPPTRCGGRTGYEQPCDERRSIRMGAVSDHDHDEYEPRMTSPSCFQRKVLGFFAKGLAFSKIVLYISPHLASEVVGLMCDADGMKSAGGCSDHA